MSSPALNCASAWVNPTSDTPSTCIVSRTYDTTTPSLLWSLLLIFYLKVLYVRGPFGFRHFENRLSIRCGSHRILCFDSWSVGRGAALERDAALLEAITPACRAVEWVIEDPSVHPRDRPSSAPSRRFIPVASHSQPALFCNYTPHSFVFALGLAIWFDLSDASSVILTQTLIPKSACNTASGTQNHNLSCCINSGGTTTLANSNLLRILAEDGQISGRACIAPQYFNSGPAHLVRRHGSISADARWRTVVIGGAIGGAAGAVILGLGIYLLFRVRRKQRATDTLPRIESQPTELQAPRSRSSPPAINHDTRSKSPQPRDAPIPSTSGVSETIDRPTSSRPQQRLLHPLDISHASHIRASTGSQFMEHFDDVRAMRTHPSEAAGNQSLPPVPLYPTASTSSQQGGESIPSIQPGASIARFSAAPLSSSDITQSPSTTYTPSLPPGAAAPVSSVGAYSPVEGSSASNGRIQLS